MNSRNRLKRAVAWSSLVLTPLAVVAAMAGCFGGPAATPGGASEAGHGPANGAAATGAGLQFDNGSYDIKKRVDGKDTVVGTLWVNNGSTGFKEIWVLATAANHVPCTRTNCDISGVTVVARSGENCTAWRTHANEIGTRNVYGVTFSSTSLTCGTGCTYDAGSDAQFSILSPGQQYQVDANRRIYVESTKSEHWFMETNLGSDGGTINTMTNTDASLQGFACGTCSNPDASLTVYAPNYTELSPLPPNCQ